ncbi:MAG: succinylglutamate desuccinylase/aspartoacylase family protein [Planctomycetes bacterium]|nr:succinylglutamate desuccinylase/aspartoacylase family protein [Planctomycetota bacterium]MCB9869325.1 succinylglutamate desuccinylase/aspartoacylase family protein [Planctomycetota bacterium]
MPDLVVGGTEIAPGQIVDVDLAVARLPTRTRLTLPVRVVHGRRPGPRLWLSAAVHGDELNGIEIVRRVLERLHPRTLNGAVLAAPIVNLHGFLHQTRDLPDGRDLNRSFPGSARGSLAARLAHLFMEEVVSKCSHGIDLHTGSGQRTNLPQVRADLGDPQTRGAAEAFGAPLLLHARLRDGSLREAATVRGVRTLLFEGGEAQRFDEDAIAVGVRGVRRVMGFLGMAEPPKGHATPSLVADRSTWVRAPGSGMVRVLVRAGALVGKGDRLGVIANAFGESVATLKAPVDGMVIGVRLNPVVYQGDAVVHIAHQPRPVRVTSVARRASSPRR